MNAFSSLKRLLGVDAGDVDAADDADTDGVRPQALAGELVDAYPDHDLDYTPTALHELDDVAVAVTADLEAAADDEAVETANENVRRLGAYLGETFVRAYDGEWTFDDSAGWVVELPATHDGQALVLTIPSVLGDVVDGDSSFALVHDVFASELDADTPELAPEDDDEPGSDPRNERSPKAVVDAFDAAASELAAEHERLDFTPASLGALDEVARADREHDTEAYDPETNDLAFEVGGHTDAVAGYFAAVIRTHHTAEYRGELAETLVVDGATRSARLEPRTLAAAAAADETSFEALYDGLREDLGLGSAGHD
jgi:hypothetical protein